MSKSQPQTHELAAGPLELRHIAAEVFCVFPFPVIVVDRSLRVVHHNAAAAGLLGVDDPGSALSSEEVLDGWHRDGVSELRRVIETGTPRRFESVGGASDGGARRLLDSVCAPLRDREAGAVVGAIMVSQDVTERAGLERRLAVSERMAAVGRLAARVAHELNNPLDGALRYINMTLRLLDPDGPEKAIGFLKESRVGLMRMAEIVGELLEFSRTSEAPFEESNINDVVDEAIRTFQDQASRRGVVIAVAFHDRDMPSVRGAKLFQVCCNLIKNAIDAMPEGGTLTVTTGVVERVVVLKFEDTGVGLPSDTAAIFEPFFTTKEPGKGTGLGLAICKEYVSRLGGTIAAANRADSGADFTIRIPVESCCGKSRRTDDTAGGTQSARSGETAI